MFQTPIPLLFPPQAGNHVPHVCKKPHRMMCHKGHAEHGQREPHKDLVAAWDRAWPQCTFEVLSYFNRRLPSALPEFSGLMVHSVHPDPYASHAWMQAIFQSKLMACRLEEAPSSRGIMKQSNCRHESMGLCTNSSIFQRRVLQRALVYRRPSEERAALSLPGSCLSHGGTSVLTLP